MTPLLNDINNENKELRILSLNILLLLCKNDLCRVILHQEKKLSELIQLCFDSNNMKSISGLCQVLLLFINESKCILINNIVNISKEFKKDKMLIHNFIDFINNYRNIQATRQIRIDLCLLIKVLLKKFTSHINEILDINEVINTLFSFINNADNDLLCKVLSTISTLTKICYNNINLQRDYIDKIINIYNNNNRVLCQYECTNILSNLCLSSDFLNELSLHNFSVINVMKRFESKKIYIMSASCNLLKNLSYSEYWKNKILNTKNLKLIFIIFKEMFENKDYVNDKNYIYYQQFLYCGIGLIDKLADNNSIK